MLSLSEYRIVCVARVFIAFGGGESEQMKGSGEWGKGWEWAEGARHVTAGFRGIKSMVQWVLVVTARLGSRGGVPGQFAAAVCSCLENGGSG